MEKKWKVYGHSDGDKIPKELHAEVIQSVEAFEKTRPWYPRLRIRARIKNQFCYIEQIEQDGSFSPLCRLRYFERYGWSFAFYVWGSNRYQACTFKDGDLSNLDSAIKAGIQACEFVHLN